MNTWQILIFSFGITLILGCIYKWIKFHLEYRRLDKELQIKIDLSDEIKQRMCSIDKIVTHYMREMDLSDKTEEERAVLKDSMTIALLFNEKRLKHIFKSIDMLLFNIGMNTPKEQLDVFFQGMEVLRENVVSGVKERHD